MGCVLQVCLATCWLWMHVSGAHAVLLCAAVELSWCWSGSGRQLSTAGRPLVGQKIGAHAAGCGTIRDVCRGGGVGVVVGVGR